MLWGGNIALGRKIALGEENVDRGIYSGEAILLWGVEVGSCSGEANVALGSGSWKLLWGGKVALGQLEKIVRLKKIAIF